MSRIDCSYCTSHLAGLFDIVQFQKISILPPQKGLEFPGGLGVLFWPYSPRGGIGNKSCLRVVLCVSTLSFCFLSIAEFLAICQLSIVYSLTEVVNAL